MMKLIFTMIDGKHCDAGLTKDGRKVRLPARMTHSADSLTAAERIASARARVVHMQSGVATGSLQWESLEAIGDMLKDALILLDK